MHNPKFSFLRISNAPIADIFIVIAKAIPENKFRGFILTRGMPGLSTSEIEGIWLFLLIFFLYLLYLLFCNMLISGSRRSSENELTLYYGFIH